MTYNPEFHHRRSIRLKGYDYSQAGAYFVTICSWNKECIFGHIRNHTMELNEFGEMVTKCWDAIPGHSPYAECDEFTVMPNHIHGIVTISNIVGAQFIAPSSVIRGASPINQNNKGVINQTNQGVINQGVINHAPTIGAIVRAFKARCTYTINQIRNTPGQPVWQRNYYEHIMRNDKELQAIREYIRYNPLKWDEDEENPEMKKEQGHGMPRP